MIDEYTTCLPTNKPNTNPNSNSNSNSTNSTPTPTPSMSVITSASGGDATDQSPVVDPVDPVDLEIVFQQSVQPITNAGRTYYYLLSKCPMTWAAFMALVGHVTDRAGWAICRVCEHKGTGFPVWLLPMEGQPFWVAYPLLILSLYRMQFEGFSVQSS